MVTNIYTAVVCLMSYTVIVVDACKSIIDYIGAINLANNCISDPGESSNNTWGDIESESMLHTQCGC